MVLLDDIVSPANRLVVGLLRSPLHRIASKGLMVLSYDGRRSGRTYTLPVGYQERDDGVTVLLSKPEAKTWWRNFRTPWPAELVLRGASTSVIGEVIAPEEDRFFDEIEQTLRRLPRMGSQFGGVKYDKDTGLTPQQRSVLADHAAVVRFVPAP